MRLEAIFAEQAWEDYLYWQQTDKKIVKRINELISATARDPFTGIGKPEPLKHALAGYWSRRVNETDRMIYKAEADSLLIAQLRYHY